MRRFCNLNELPLTNLPEGLNFPITPTVLGELIWLICESQVESDSSHLILFCWTARCALIDMPSATSQMCDALDKTKAPLANTYEGDKELEVKLIKWWGYCFDWVVDFDENDAHRDFTPEICAEMFQHIIDIRPEVLKALAYKAGALHPFD